ncbi:MAG: hypothetical protein LC122_11995 [Chitinophagales bacterium]|nr:hypothetical protein [Chitinophagales bacterium]
MRLISYGSTELSKDFGDTEVNSKFDEFIKTENFKEGNRISVKDKYEKISEYIIEKDDVEKEKLRDTWFRIETIKLVRKK